MLQGIEKRRKGCDIDIMLLKGLSVNGLRAVSWGRDEMNLSGGRVQETMQFLSSFSAETKSSWLR